MNTKLILLFIFEWILSNHDWVDSTTEENSNPSKTQTFIDLIGKRKSSPERDDVSFPKTLSPDIVEIGSKITGPETPVKRRKRTRRIRPKDNSAGTNSGKPKARNEQSNSSNSSQYSALIEASSVPYTIPNKSKTDSHFKKSMSPQGHVDQEKNSQCSVPQSPTIMEIPEKSNLSLDTLSSYSHSSNVYGFMYPQPYGYPTSSPQTYGYPTTSPQTYGYPTPSLQSHGYPTPSPQSYGYPTPYPQPYGYPTPSPQTYGYPTPSPQPYGYPTPSPQTYGYPTPSPQTYSYPTSSLQSHGYPTSPLQSHGYPTPPQTYGYPTPSPQTYGYPTPFHQYYAYSGLSPQYRVHPGFFPQQYPHPGLSSQLYAIPPSQRHFNLNMPPQLGMNPKLTSFYWPMNITPSGTEIPSVSTPATFNPESDTGSYMQNSSPFTSGSSPVSQSTLALDPYILKASSTPSFQTPLPPLISPLSFPSSMIPSSTPSLSPGTTLTNPIPTSPVSLSTPWPLPSTSQTLPSVYQTPLEPSQTEDSSFVPPLRSFGSLQSLQSLQNTQLNSPTSTSSAYTSEFGTFKDPPVALQASPSIPSSETVQSSLSVSLTQIPSISALQGTGDSLKNNSNDFASNVLE